MQPNIKLLENGLKFTPTPKADQANLVKETEDFCLKLQIENALKKKNKRKTH